MDNLNDITSWLKSVPDTLVEVVAKPDDICPPCPFLAESGCTETGPDSEKRIRRRDLAVLKLLELKSEDLLPWNQILKAVSTLILPKRLDSLCRDCRWLELGYCKEGLTALVSEFPENSKISN